MEDGVSRYVEVIRPQVQVLHTH